MAKVGRDKFMASNTCDAVQSVIKYKAHVPRLSNPTGRQKVVTCKNVGTCCQDRDRQGSITMRYAKPNFIETYPAEELRIISDP